MGKTLNIVIGMLVSFAICITILIILHFLSPDNLLLRVLGFESLFGGLFIICLVGMYLAEKHNIERLEFKFSLFVVILLTILEIYNIGYILNIFYDKTAMTILLSCSILSSAVLWIVLAYFYLELFTITEMRVDFILVTTLILVVIEITTFILYFNISTKIPPLLAPLGFLFENPLTPFLRIIIIEGFLTYFLVITCYMMWLGVITRSTYLKEKYFVYFTLVLGIFVSTQTILFISNILWLALLLTIIGIAASMIIAFLLGRYYLKILKIRKTKIKF